MSMKIRRAAVLGAGVMGAQIAAHLSAAGVRVYLLDLPGKEAPKDPKLAKVVGKNIRSAPAILAMDNLKKLKPSPLLSKDALKGIIPGNFEDDFSVIAEADWVIEVVIEKLEIKKDIHKRIAEYVRPGVPISTNTSGISLGEIAEDMSEEYVKQFFATHFFNPPRYMHLLEVIPHAETDKDMVANLSSWISERLGKGIVLAHDTINFIGNRIGVFTIQSTLKHMTELGLNIETVDALTGKLMGRPASGTFRTMDVVGLDTFSFVAQNVYDKVKDDPYHSMFATPEWIQGLISEGSLGQKAKGKGCYLKSKDEKGKRLILAYRPESRTYEPQDIQSFPWQKEAAKIASLPERLNFIAKHDDAGAELIWRVLRDTLSYSAMLLEEIAGGVPLPVDNAIKWGFNWEMGPFELWQAMGIENTLTKMKNEGSKIPSWLGPKVKFFEPDPGSSAWETSGYTQQLSSMEDKFIKIPPEPHRFHLPKKQTKNDPRVVLSNKSSSLLDIGHGIGCLVFHTKMNAIDMDLLELAQKSMAIAGQKFDGLVIANEGKAFSAGANLKYMLELIHNKDFDGIDHMLRSFQGTMQLIKYSPIPVVSCPFGMTLGGGCEVSLHTSWRMVASETYAGLVEAGVGLIPAGGGTKELALRAYDMASKGEKVDPMAYLYKAFMLIGMAQVSTSGFETIENGIYPSTTMVSISREHQLAKAKSLAMELAEQGYIPPMPNPKVKALGDNGIQTFKMALYNMKEGRMISDHDMLIGEKVATVLCGGEVDPGTSVSEQYLLDLERRVFVELCKEQKTVDRIEHMLKTGKPLRN